MLPAELTTNALPSPPLAAISQPEAPPTHAAEPSAIAPHAQPTSPATQITPALMQVRHASDGSQQLTVRLDPPELGQVQVKIDRPSDAPARVEITAEKPETLTLLLRDQVQLQRALDQAGVPADGRNVTFHIAQPEAPLRNDPGTAPVANTASGAPTGDSSQGTAHQRPKSARQGHDTADDGGAEFTSIAASRWMRAGLDITA
jgi:hypothetical protein